MLGNLFVHHHHRAAAVGELAGVAGGDQATGNGRAQAADAILGRAVTNTFVVAHRHLFGHEAHHLVRDTHGDRNGGNFSCKQTCSQRGSCLLLAGSPVLIHCITADVVAFGHVFGCLQHVPVNFGLVLDQPRIGQHMHIHLLLYAGNGLHTPRYINVALIGNDALRCQCNGLQTRRAKAINRHARHSDGATSAQCCLACNVGPGCPLGVCASHDDVIHLGCLDASALDGMLHRVTAQRGAMGHVEGTFPAFGQGGACGGYDYCGSHVGFL